MVGWNQSEMQREMNWLKENEVDLINRIASISFQDAAKPNERKEKKKNYI